MAKQKRFIRIDVIERIRINIGKLRRGVSRTPKDEGLHPPTVEYLMAQGFTLDEALAIIAQWYINHPGYEP